MRSRLFGQALIGEMPVLAVLPLVGATLIGGALILELHARSRNFSAVRVRAAITLRPAAGVIMTMRSAVSAKLTLA